MGTKESDSPAPTLLPFLHLATRIGSRWQNGHLPRCALRWIIFLPQIFLPARPAAISERGTKEWGQRNPILLPTFYCRPLTSQYRPFTHMDRDDPSSPLPTSRRVRQGGSDPAGKSTGELPRAGDFGERRGRDSGNGKYEIRSDPVSRGWRGERRFDRWKNST